MSFISKDGFLIFRITLSFLLANQRACEPTCSQEARKDRLIGTKAQGKRRKRGKWVCDRPN